MYPNGQLPKLLIVLLGEDGEKKLVEYIKNTLTMVSQTASLAALEISLWSTGYKKAALPEQKLKMQFYRDTSLYLTKFISTPDI